MATTGFFTNTGGVGIGGSSNANLKSIFSGPTRFLVAKEADVNDVTNRLFLIGNDHNMVVHCNSYWLNGGVSLVEIPVEDRGFGGKVSFTVNGDIEVERGSIYLYGNQSGDNAFAMKAAVNTADYSVTWPATGPGNNQILVFQSDGTMAFADDAGNVTLQSAYNNNESTLADKGKIILLDDGPMYFQGAAMTNDKPIFMVTRGTTVGAGNSGEHLQVRTSVTSANYLDFSFNGQNFNIKTNGNIDMDATGSVNIDSSVAGINAIVINASGNTGEIAISTAGNGSIDIDAGSNGLNMTATAGNLDIVTATSGDMTLTSAGTVDIDANGGDLSLDSSSGINIGTATSVNVDIDAAILSLDATGGITIDTTSGGISIDAAAGPVNVGAALSTLALTSSDTLTVESTGSGIDVNAAGAITIDTSTGGISIDADAGDVNLSAASGTLGLTSSGDLTVDSTGGILDLLSNSDLTINSSAGIVDIDADGGALSLDSTTRINIGIATDVPIDINSTTLDIDASGLITIDTSNNSDISLTAGGTGNVNVTGDTITLTGNVVITQNLYVNGNVTSVNTDQLNVTDPLILLGNGNAGDAKDLGLLLEYNNGSKQHAAFFRDASGNNKRFVLANKCTFDEASSVVTVTEYAGLELTQLKFTHNGSDESEIIIPTNEANALDIEDNNGNIIMTFNTLGGADGSTVTINGNLTVAATTGEANGVVKAVQFLTTSDATLKTNIKTIENPLGMMESFNGVSYTWKSREDMVEPIYGVLAQEVERVMPGAVNTDAFGMKTVAYHQITGVLVEAIKALSAEVSNLKAQLFD